MMSRMKEEIHTTCPRDCYDACGIVVVKEQGEIVRVKGDPGHPFSKGSLCSKCTIAYNGAWLDSNKRLTKPLQRIGTKGEGKFAPISWEAAFETIAVRLKHILSVSNGQSILHTHYTGTCSLIAGLFPMRFFNFIGATEVDPDTVCNKAGHLALEIIFGTSLIGFDPRTAKDANCILVWGANPSASAPHAHKHWLPESPGKLIVVDPIRHPTAEAADLYLQPFPGSDAALAFAMLHVIHREGLLDESFLSSNAIGWDEVLPLLPQCTPTWGESVTGVPASLIVEAAEIYGKGPSLLWLGQGLQRQLSGGNVFRACSLLPIATGNIGKKGAGFLFMNGPGTRGFDTNYVSGPHLISGESPVPSISHMDLAERLENAVETKALFCWNNNIVASSPEQTRLRKALERENLFMVSIDLFPTDTTDYADLILPAASFLEFNDLIIPYFKNSISAQVKTAEPMGESLPNQEIFRRLAATMGYEEPELFEDDTSLITNLLKQTGKAIDFAELAKSGTEEFTVEPIIQFEELQFPTPSGKIEIVSKRFEEEGLQRVPQPFAEKKSNTGRLRLLSPASPWLMNSSYGNDARIRSQIGTGDVFLNPQEASSRDIEEGMEVILSNETGKLQLLVRFSKSVPRGVALVYKGRWPKHEHSRANVNVLNSGQKTDLGQSNAVHSIEVDITPISVTTEH